ncbi:hypothetical protein [uncultured Capnocytophaga sp.]|uniref:hypothetical protein n=1 Tax=uncultured Capnocytophaga sp. TaxID=159273 RepID=UPI0026299268|nr:hypothetical protein [uncultured Capnocytophaga sp.]
MGRIFLISDYNFTLQNQCVIHLKDTPQAIIEQIENTKVNPEDLFLIYLDYIPQEEGKAVGLRTNHHGIEVLKRLRLKHYRQHCVVFSFLSREDFILQNPCHLVLYSAGITYKQLPFDFLTEDFSILEAPVEAPSDLSAYFKAENMLPDNRHFFANWWGVYCLWQLHKAIESIYLSEGENSSLVTETDRDFFSGMKKIWEEMNTLRGQIAQYLNPIDKKDILFELQEFDKLEKNRDKLLQEIDSESSITEEELIELAEIREKLENFLKKLGNKTIYDLDIQIEYKNILNEYYYNLNEGVLGRINGKFLSATERLIYEINKKIEEIKSKDDQINKNKELIEEKNELDAFIEEIRRKIKENIEGCNIQRSKKSISDIISDIRKSFQEVPPKIIYVDDQAQEGWAKIFQRMIYGGESDNFAVIVPQKEEDEKEIVQRILNEEKRLKENTNQIVLLILDLRLKQEKGELPIEDISGIKVLKELKKEKFSCPILITTASNKWKSYKEINRLGALAYWQKKGLDEQNDTKSLLENYFSFLKLIYVLCKDKTIAFLYNNFSPMIRELEENEEVYWWETAFWRKAEKTINSKSIKIKDDKITVTAISGEMIEILHKSYLEKETQEEQTYVVSKEKILGKFRESWELYLGFVSEKILYDDFQLENSAKDDIISVKKKNNAIIVVYLFNILESIYKIRESDISMYNRLLYLTNTRDIQMNEIKEQWLDKIAPKKQQDPDIFIDTLLRYIGIITNRRNIATHQLDCNKKDLHSFIKGLFLFLKNHDLCFYEEEDRLKPKNNDTEITPMPQ